jgi:hypothetical protein
VAGKGDLRRPAAIPKDEFDRRWSEAFGRAAPCGSDQAGRRERQARKIGQLELPMKAAPLCQLCDLPAGVDPTHAWEWQLCAKHEAEVDALP